MELSSSSEAANFIATQEIPNILWNPKVHCRGHKSPPLAPTLSHINPLYTTQTNLPNIYFSIIHLHTSWSS
jgi:hypothetical protein